MSYDKTVSVIFLWYICTNESFSFTRTCQKKHPLGLTLGAFRLILLKDGRCAFAKRHQKLVQTTKDLVDEVWINCLLAEINAVIVHPLNFAGRSVADKLKDVRKKPVQEQAQDSIFSFFRMVNISRNMECESNPYLN